MTNIAAAILASLIPVAMYLWKRNLERMHILEKFMRKGYTPDGFNSDRAKVDAILNSIESCWVGTNIVEDVLALRKNIVALREPRLSGVKRYWCRLALDRQRKELCKQMHEKTWWVRFELVVIPFEFRIPGFRF